MKTVTIIVEITTDEMNYDGKLSRFNQSLGMTHKPPMFSGAPKCARYQADKSGGKAI